MDFDIITVQLVPEKKGLFLKHSEYEVRVSSRHCLSYKMLKIIQLESFEANMQFKNTKRKQLTYFSCTEN